MAYISRKHSIKNIEPVSTNVMRILFLILVVFGAGVSAFSQAVEPGAANPIQFGDPGAQFRIEVFVDYQCPACADYYARLKSVEVKYPEKVNLVYRHYPLQMQDKAMIAAKAVESANAQGKALEMIDLMFANQKSWTGDPKVKMFLGYARKLELDLEQFKRDFDSLETLGRIERDISRAKFLNLNATPSVFVNDKPLTYVEALDIENFFSDGNY